MGSMESFSVPQRHHFRDWLWLQEKCSVVGHAGDDHDCPLARFLAARAGERVVVGLTSAVVTVYPPVRSELPTWAKEFVSRVDDQDEEAISRERALSILETVL